MKSLTELEHHNIDIQSYLLLKNGLKPVIRTEMPPGAVKKTRDFCEKAGLKMLAKKPKSIYGGELKNSVLIYISLSERKAKQAYDSELSGERLEFGKLLGYPECCVKSFINSMKESDNNFTVKAFSNTSTEPSFYCNNLFLFDSKINEIETQIYLKNFDILKKNEHLFLIRHIPCRFDCKESIKIGKKTLELLKKHKPQLAEETTNALRRQFLYFDHFNWAVFDGKVDQNEMRYKRVLPYKSLLGRGLVRKISQGNVIKLENNKTVILKDDKELTKIPKKGLLINFR